MLEIWFPKDLTLPAVWIDDSCITYGKLLEKINTVCFSLTTQGVVAGNRVALIAETNLDTITTFFALLKLRASPCLLSARLPENKIPSYLVTSKASFFLNVTTGIAKRCASEIETSEQAILLFTSGSSSSPKLVSLKIEHFLASAQGSIEKLNLVSNSSWLLSVPLFHVSGLSILFRCLLSSSAFILTVDLLKGHPFATHISLVPTQLLRILERSSSFPLLKCALIGGAPISETLIQRALEKQLPLYLTYGMTEMASQITMTCYFDTLLPVHLGKPLPGKEISFSNEGEILVKGNSLFTGYESADGAQKTLLDGGWLATRDLGSLDAQGNLKYKGRKDNLFISGGENIYPEPIEEALGSIPGVLQALVVPFDDPEFGKRPAAFVYMQEKMLSKEEFHERLSTLLPRFCLPVHFLPFPEGYKEKSFKLKRSELTALLHEILLEKV